LRAEESCASRRNKEMFELIEFEGPPAGSSGHYGSAFADVIGSDRGPDVTCNPPRSVLIANGASGLGQLLAKRFSETGYRVFLTSRDEAKLADLESQLSGVTTFACDLAAPGQAAWMLSEVGERAGSLDVLVYLSGEPVERNLAISATLDGIAEEIEAELSAPVKLVELAMPLLRAARPATIIFVTSAHPVATSPVHAAAMAGVRAFARSARHQLARMAIRVVEIVPPPARIGRDSGVTRKMIADAAIKALRGGEREVFVGPTRPLRRDICGPRPARATPWHIAGYG